MDTIPPDDFLGIFHRICHVVRLGRVRSDRDIRKRIKNILDFQRKAMQTAQRGSTVRKYRGDYNRLRTLYRNHIEVRIWNEAVDNPGGIIDETLDYGYENAQRMALERARARAGRLKRLKRRRG